MAMPRSAFDDAALAFRFREEWSEAPADPGLEPDVFSYLEEAPHASPREIADVVLVDLHHRFQRDCPLAPEHYFERLPILTSDLALMADVASGEAIARRERGETVSPERFASRFPRIREELIQRLSPGADFRSSSRSASIPAPVPVPMVQDDPDLGAAAPRAKGDPDPSARTRPANWLRRTRWGLAGAFLLLLAASMVWNGWQTMRAKVATTPWEIDLPPSKVWDSGTQAAVRAVLRDQPSSSWVSGASVKFSLRGGSPSREHAVAEATSDAQGLASSHFVLPDLPAGPYELAVTAQFPTGEETAVQPVRIVRRIELMVSADKPIHQPGQTIRIRALGLRQPSLKPMAGEKAEFAVLDPKDNVIFKQSATASAFGIASAECPIDAQANPGDYRIRCRMSDAERIVQVRVEKYVLPKIQATLTLDRSTVKPGETIKGRVRASYFFGEPVAGGQAVVRLDGLPGGLAPPPRPLTLGPDGTAEFAVPVPTLDVGELAVRAVAQVQDSAGQRQAAGASLRIAAQTLAVEARAEEAIVDNDQQGLRVLARATRDGKPVPAQVTVLGRTVTADAQGRAEILLARTPPATGVQAQAAFDGETAFADVVLPSVWAGLEVRLNRPEYQAGEPVGVEIAGVADGLAHLDLYRDDQLSRTFSVAIVNRRGSLTFPAPDEGLGAFELVARRSITDAASSRKRLPIRAKGALQVKLDPDRESYRPGETAKLRLAIQDAQGKPAAGAISLAAIDPAVFAAAPDDLTDPPQRIGGERAFFVKEPGPSAVRSQPTILLGMIHGEKVRQARMESSRIRDQQERANQWLRIGLGVLVLAWVGFLWIPYLVYAIRNPVSRPLGIAAAVITALLAIAAPLLMLSDAVQLTADSAAPTARPGDRAFRGDPKSADEMMPPDAAFAALGGEAPRVRESFPETLLWRPELVTDDQGRADVDLTLADTVTNWRVLAGAVSANGGLGGAETEIKAFQPFQVDLNVPATLTRNDELEVPVVVYNFLDKPQTVTLVLKSEGLTLSGDAERKLDLAANAVVSTVCRVRASKIGRFPLEVAARGDNASDAIRRMIDVVSDGRKIEVLANGVLDAPATVDLRLPANAIEGSARGSVKFYPSTFSQLLDGMEGILRMPSGCFEQTSSSTYPNILALQYLRTTKTSKPQVEENAQRLIHMGLQRLLSFEIAGGGFDWFGHPPANRLLTAYGMMEFRDMAEVRDVDPRLIERTRQWLLNQQRPDGSWQAEGHGVRDGIHAYADGASADLRTTAYIAWAVYDGLAADSPASSGRTLTFLTAKPAESFDDPYTLALLSNALLSMDRSGQAAAPYLRRLAGLKSESPDRKQAWWGEAPTPAPTGDRRTLFFGGGPAQTVETTALAAIALKRSGQHSELNRAALNWLVSQRDPRGTWHSTQATILTLKALVMAASGGTSEESRTLELAIDAGGAERIAIPADQADVVHQTDLTSKLTAGPHRVALADVSKSGTVYQVSLSYYVPETDPEPLGDRDQAASPGPLAIDLTYEKTRIKTNETIRVRAKLTNRVGEPVLMPIAVLPIPAGFAIDAPPSGPEIAKTELQPDRVIVYLRALDKKASIELTYRLQPLMPVKSAARPALAYEYYNPSRQSFSRGVELVAAP